MSTVLNFFAVYVWHLLGYAVAFHILLPGEEGSFRSLFHSCLKVFTFFQTFSTLMKAYFKNSRIRSQQ